MQYFNHIIAGVLLLGDCVYWGVYTTGFNIPWWPYKIILSVNTCKFCSIFSEKYFLESASPRVSVCVYVCPMHSVENLSKNVMWSFCCTWGNSQK